MDNLKHVGRIKTNNRRVVVAYKTVPDEPENCIVVTTENLSADEHDTLMKLVESPAGQESFELADAMARARLPDGRIMLSAFHTTGKLVKQPTNVVEMTPNSNTSIMLSELNELIAQQQGTTVKDLSVSPAETAETYVKNAEENTSSELSVSDEDQAAQYRSEADRLFKEAKRLREMAEEISPTKKKKKAEVGEE